jgi:O-antigen/teichoic acid export membrane protein
MRGEMKTNVNLDKRLLFINSLSSLLSWILKTGLLFVLQRFLLSRVSLEEYSLYPVISSIMAFVELLRSLLSGGISRFIVEADVQGKRDQVTSIATTMFVIQGAASIALLVLGSVFTWNIANVLSVAPQHVHDARIMMGIMIGSFVIHLATTSFEVGLFARQKFVILNGLELASVTVRILLIIVFFSTMGVRVIWIVLASELANVLIHITRIAISMKVIPALRFVPRTVDWVKARQMLSFSSWNFINAISNRLNTNFDPLILNRLGSPFDVTVFYIGSLVKKQIMAVLQRITTPLVPSLIEMHTLNRQDMLRTAYYRYGKYFTWLYMAAALPFMAFNREFISLYVGAQYLTAAPVMLILFFSSAIGLGNAMIAKLSVAQGNVKPIAIRSVITQSANVLLTIYLVAALRLGAMGSAIASLVATATLQIGFDFALAYRMIRIRPGELFKNSIIPGFMPSILSAGVFLMIRAIDSPDTWFKLLLYSAAGEIVYIALIVVFSTRDELAALTKLATNLKGRIIRRDRDTARNPEPATGSEA